MTEIQNIAWKRLSVEAAAIVASILLAFSIDAWWDERQDRKYEQEALRGLHAEYLDHKTIIGEQRTRHRMYLRGVAGLMAACQRGFWESDEFSVDEAIFHLQVPVTTDLGAGVRDSLISAGRIDVIMDKQLRYEITAWDSIMDELSDDQILNRSVVESLIVPYLTKKHVPMSAANDIMKTAWPTATRSISTDVDLLAALFADPEFHSIVEYRYALLSHASDEFDNVLLEIDGILDRIEGSLAD